MNVEIKRKYGWINCAKAVAILAVLFAHNQNVLYQSPIIHTISLFHVQLFAILMGMTAFFSHEKRNETWYRYFIRECCRIIPDYIIASALYLIQAKQGLFSFSELYTSLIHFNANLVLWYVSFYLQLALVSIGLYQLVKTSWMNSRIRRILFFIVICMFSIYFTNYTLFLGNYGGSGRLFGGTYFALYTLGMLLAREKYQEFKSSRNSLIKLICCGISAIILVFIMSRENFQFNSIFWLNVDFQINPAPPILCFYGFVMLGFCFGLFTIMEQSSNRIVNFIYSCFSWLGARTLGIYLFHTFVINTLLKIMPVGTILNGNWDFIVYLSAMITIPLLMERVINWLRKVIIPSDWMR